jgi:beta-phosphoglucomutase family hydrolase
MSSTPASPEEATRPRPAEVFATGRFDAVLFDLDGVLTSTAKIHAACWKRMFDDFLHKRSASTGEPFRPFDVDADYKQYVDGKPRYDGVRSFLESRGITLPDGSPDAPPEEDSIHGLGNRKDILVTQAIAAGRVEAYPGALALLRWVRGCGLKTAVVSSSHHCLVVLQAVGIDREFDTRVDGGIIDRLHLPGKPAPDTYLHAAKELGVSPVRAVVIEDAIAGVQSGRAGHFGLVVGVDRGGNAEGLRQNGADVVVSNLGDLIAQADGGHKG